MAADDDVDLDQFTGDKSIRDFREFAASPFLLDDEELIAGAAADDDVVMDDGCVVAIEKSVSFVSPTRSPCRSGDKLRRRGDSDDEARLNQRIVFKWI